MKRISVKSTVILLVICLLAVACGFFTSGYTREKIFGAKPGESARDLRQQNEMAQKVAAFLDEMDAQVAEAFDISLKDCSKVEDDTLNDQQQAQFKSLRERYFEVVREQQQGDIRPSIYIYKDDALKGFILEKKADGTDCIYRLTQENNQWKSGKVDKKPGKPPVLEKD